MANIIHIQFSPVPQFRQLQIKIVRYHYIPIKIQMAKIQENRKTKRNPQLKTRMWRWSNRKSHSLLVEMQSSPSNHTPRYLLKGLENLCPHKNLYMDIYSSFMIP